MFVVIVGNSSSPGQLPAGPDWSLLKGIVGLHLKKDCG